MFKKNFTLRKKSRGAPNDVEKGSITGQDPLGLRVLYRPLGDHRVDIVFVHGLGGSSRLTWSKHHNLDYFWPLKFLPFEPGINEARISTFGYNANFRPGSGKNKMSILDFAKGLLFDLKYGRDNLDPNLEELGMGERPIIFVVHSMGGLIVKEAYMQGQIDPTYKSIIKSVKSIIFLSTPHRGTNLAETLNRILQVSFVTNPMQFIAELAVGSQTLQKLNEQFRHVASNLQIVSFYETRPAKMFKTTEIMVLEKDSSVLGYPGEISNPLDADHHGVCKFESPEDPHYVAVRNVLRSLIGKAKPLTENELERKVKEDPRPKFEEYLSVSESPERDYNFFRDRWTTGTCNWILNNVSFKSWLHDNHCAPRALWIHGNAASGKSILSSFVINHIVQLGLPCQYFFIRFEDKKKRTLSLVLRSLACQLARSTPAYADKLHKLETAATDLKTADYKNIWQWLYKQSLSQLGINYPIYWVIDGVDEAESPESIIALLSELQLTAIPIRILVVSRKTHEISSAFQKLSKQVHVETICTEGNQQDLICYINQEIDVAGEDSYRTQVISQIIERARGNFLWVHLAVQKINKCHTKMDVDNALNDLPPGMEALYGRMANFVRTQPNNNNRVLAKSILDWVACTQRPLNVEELCDALGNDGLLDLHRTIGELCGGFVVVDQEGKAAMVHATALEYLFIGHDGDHLLVIDQTSTNNKLFERCILRLMDPTLRSQINRNRPPALLDYATTSWFIHLSRGSATHSNIIQTLMKFFRGPYVLNWINTAAERKQLRALVVASRHLADVVLKLRKLGEEECLAHHQAINILARWTTDLVKIVGKFGTSLTQNPDSIYKLIPPFCPKDSIIYQQFGRKESKALDVSVFTSSNWDDCLACLPLEQGVIAAAIHVAGSHIIILTHRQNSGHIFIYNSVTFEEELRITHPERVFNIQVDKMGEKLVSYGFKTTKLWDMGTGRCVKTVKNPAKRSRPQTLLFVEQDNHILVVSEDRCIRTLSLDENDSTGWEPKALIDEQSLDDTILNAPTCSVLNPSGNMIAFGYRGHPVTIWELEPLMLISQCNVTSHEADMTIQENIRGETIQLIWHPFSGEILSLYREGLLFKWDPYDEEPSVKAHTGAYYMAISRDGTLVATGDAVGTIKMYTTANLSLLYQLSSQDPVLQLSFSTDSRRLYDIRGAYGNVWEPSTLVHLANSSEYTDHSSDTWTEIESLAKLSHHTAHHFPRVDNIITLSGHPGRPLYCYGTEDGVAVLCEVGRGKICDLERLPSYMSIEQVAWSDDGKLVAIADLSGRLSIKTIRGQDQNTWEVHHDFHIMIPARNGPISQLFFDHKNLLVVAPTPKALYTVDINTRDLAEFIFPPGMPQVRWICHPTLPDFLLGFGNTTVHVFKWSNLQDVETYTYSPLRPGKSATISSNQPLHDRGSSFRAADEFLGRLISHIDSPDILLEISHLTPTGRQESEYLVFQVSDINIHSSSGNEVADKEGDVNTNLPYILLSADIASHIRESLALLSRRRLVFLDSDRWICTWRLPSLENKRLCNGKGSDQGTNKIERHYFLPGDWATSNEAHLCSIMSDGTLLCPRRNDVATVKCAKLRK